MKKVLINFLAIIIGLFIGSMVNMSLINLSSSIIPPPNGIDVTTEEGLQAAMHLFEPKHFIFPFLAHALGTLTGAFFTALIARSYKKTLALIIGCFFLIGGVVMIYMLPSPLWFSAIDLILAYIPFSYLGYKAANSITNRKRI